jgi:hypothetical protein
MTTGPAFVRWKQQLGNEITESDRRYWIEHQSKVVEENLARVAPVVVRLRKTLPDPLIEPTSLSVAGWTQGDYRAFWCEVIRRWCHSIVLSEGWQFSTGCCFEATAAIHMGLHLLNEDLEEIDTAVVAANVSEARDELVSIGMATDDYLDAAELLLASVAKSASSKRSR